MTTKVETISGMHKNGCRFFMTVPQGISRKEFLNRRDIDYDGETFGAKIKRLQDHYKGNKEKE